MADSTIDSEDFYLLDMWPGTVFPHFGEPPEGFTGATHHDVSSAEYELGTKIQVRNDSGSAGLDGFSTFIYLKVGTQNPDVDIAAKSAVTMDAATTPYTVTNDSDGDIVTGSGPLAYALSAMTDAYYGWFWCGGVCPEAFVSDLAGNFATDGTVVAGSFCTAALAASDAPLGIGTTSDVDTGGVTPALLPVGVAQAADA